MIYKTFGFCGVQTNQALFRVRLQIHNSGAQSSVGGSSFVPMIQIPALDMLYKQPKKEKGDRSM
jgi:hypothetical protein